MTAAFTIRFGVAPLNLVLAGSLAGQRALADQMRDRMESESREIDRVLRVLSETADEMAEQQRHRLGEMQQVAVKLAVAIAGRLVRDKIDSGEFAVESLVREAVERLETEQAVTVRLHQDDLALLQRRLGDASPIGGGPHLKLIVGAALNRGDCTAETAEMAVIAKLDAQLEEMRRQLLGNLADAEIERRKTMPNGRGLRRFPDRRQTA